MNECPLCSRCYADSVTECGADGELLRRAFDGPPLIDSKYELRRALGRGGMGVVYLAYHRGLQRDVALKLIRPTRQGSEFLSRFRAEATALGRLKHPHIVNVTDFGVDPRDAGMPYLAMEHLTGVTLAQALRPGAIAVADALPILKAIASAIDFAHEHDVLHRDIKPENVFLSNNDGARPVVKVLDFGVAHIGRRLNSTGLEGFADHVSPRGDPAAGSDETASADDERTRAATQVDATVTETVAVGLTTPGQILGTLSYQAPELLAGDKASPASDVYAFGVLAFQTVVGERPYKVSQELAIYDTAPAAHTINKTLAPEISRILAWPLSRYAADRPRSACEFVDELRRVYFQSLVESWKRTELPRRRRLAAAAALLLCGIAWVADRSGWGESVERRLVDARFRYAPGRLPDPRLLVVVVDDTSLTASPTLLGERADEFSDRFEQIFEAGASGVAVDFLLPQRWSASPQFSRLVLTHVDRLALAATSGPDGQVVGPECIAGLTAAALGPQRASAVFGFVDMEPDGDGVIRRARLTFQDTSGAQRDSFAVRSIRAALGDGAITAALQRQQADPPGEGFLIDAAVDRRRLSTLSWSRVPDQLAKDPAIFRDRLVLVGGSFVGSSDFHRLSGQRVPIEGVLVQALIMDTILKALPIREIGIAMWLPIVFLAAWVAMEGSVLTHRFPMPTWTIAVAGAWVIAAVTLFVVAGWTVPILVPLATIVMAGVTARFIRPLLKPFPRPDAGLV